MNARANAAAQLEAARGHARRGEAMLAERQYLDLLQNAPDNLEALNFVAMCALGRGEPGRAIRMLDNALQLQPDQPLTLKNLGAAYGDSGRLDEAEAVLRKAAALAPELRSARLLLAQVLERAGRGDEALRVYFEVIVAAQRRGEWTSEATTPKGLLQQVLHAIAYVREHRRAIFMAMIEPLRARHGAEAVRRAELALQIYLGDCPAGYVDARQRPKFLYFPGLPTQPYFPREAMPWLSSLEQATAVVQDELRQVLSSTGRDGVEPFLKLPPGATAERYLAGRDAPPAWDAFFFYRHGVRNDANCARCPATAALLESLPVARIRDHAPEICFSILTPGTHILPHHGVTNARIVVHLPLIVPRDCALSVGGEIHAWQEGRCVAFDDTFQHEAWNRSAETRAVLILDAWNPYLSSVECGVINELIVAIGAFNRECGLDAET